MAKKLFDIVSVRKLRRLGADPAPDDAFGLLARNIINALDARGEKDAEDVLLEVMRDYFFNLAATSKRRLADSVALAYCENREDFDDLWEYFKVAGVTGRTRT